MTSSYSTASLFSPSLRPHNMCRNCFIFLFLPAALLRERGRQILWQLQCFHLTPDGAASVYFADQLLAKTTSSGSTQSAASPMGSLRLLALSLRFMSSETHFFFLVFFFPPLLFCCLRPTQFLIAVSFFLVAKCFSMKSPYLFSCDNFSRPPPPSSPLSPSLLQKSMVCFLGEPLSSPDFVMTTCDKPLVHSGFLVGARGRKRPRPTESLLFVINCSFLCEGHKGQSFRLSTMSANCRFVSFAFCVGE